jgi:carbon storage regulator CsrA
MLILTRRPGEAIRVGEVIEIVVLDVVGQQVRLARVYCASAEIVD